MAAAWCRPLDFCTRAPRRLFSSRINRALARAGRFARPAAPPRTPPSWLRPGEDRIGSDAGAGRPIPAVLTATAAAGRNPGAGL